MELEISMVKKNKTQRLLVLGWICSHMCLRTKDGSLFRILLYTYILIFKVLNFVCFLYSSPNVVVICSYQRGDPG